MKIRNTITKVVTLTMVVAAMAVIGSTVTAEAQQHVRVFEGISFAGVIPGQMLRFSVLNLNAPEQGSQPARAQVLLYDAQGNVLARSQEVELSPGQFRIFDFNRDDLSPAGDPGTGRLQVRGVYRLFLDDGSTLTPEQFPVSMEVVDNRTGKTVLGYQNGYVGWVKISPDA
jgi:hypothetical protein